MPEAHPAKHSTQDFTILPMQPSSLHEQCFCMMWRTGLLFWCQLSRHALSPWTAHKVTKCWPLTMPNADMSHLLNEVHALLI